MSFDQKISRYGTHSAKWDLMQANYGIQQGEGLAMWIADMDFRPPAVVQHALEGMLAHGIYGYFGNEAAYLDAICWWMQKRHGWQVEREHILSAHGLVNGTGLCVQACTEPGDGIVLTTPVYHAFARTIRAAGRKVVECELAVEDGIYRPDFRAWDAQMTGDETMFILCSPHNPGGRVWTAEELRGVADFCKRHDLILVSDEIHHDLIYLGQKHIPMAVAAPDIADRLIMMTAATKSFNIAGSHTGNLIVADPVLRKRFTDTFMALGISPNSFGLVMTTAAYSPEGAAWIDDLMVYLKGNRDAFDEGLSGIAGLTSMPLQSTYLSWVDFSGTGMETSEIVDRVQSRAKIATNAGVSFGKGGESFLRFNIGMPRADVLEATERLRLAFSNR